MRHISNFSKAIKITKKQYMIASMVRDYVPLLSISSLYKKPCCTNKLKFGPHSLQIFRCLNYNLGTPNFVNEINFARITFFYFSNYFCIGILP